MRQVHCDGCNRTEPLDTPKSESVMLPVTLTFENDSREWAGTNARYSSDLCDRCRIKLLHTFFRVPAELDPEIPAFLSQPLSALGI